MVIEFIGSTGAGKTTLFSAVQSRLAETTKVTTSFCLVAAQLRLQGVAHPSLQNLTLELVGFPFFLRSLPRHRALVTFALGILARQATLTLNTVNILRSLVRKIGVNEIIRRNNHNHTVLIDEGMMVLAHNLFVYSGAHYTVDEVAKFVTLIPLPDSIIYVKAPIESLIQRACIRIDRRRDIQSRSRTQLEAYVSRTVDLYEQLISVECVRGRVLTVDNPETAKRANGKAIDAITEFVLGHLSPNTEPVPEGNSHVN